MSCANCGCESCGGSNRRGCCPIGLLVEEIPAGDASVTLTRQELKNASHPNVWYDAVRFTGGQDSVTVSIFFPEPASLDDAYSIEVENRSEDDIRIFSGNAGTSLILKAFQVSEQSLEEEIQDVAATTWTYRTRVRFLPGGAFRVPGFTGQ